MDMKKNEKLHKLKAISIADIFMALVLIGAIAAAFIPKFVSGDKESQIRAKLQDAYTFIANKQTVLEAASNSAPENKNAIIEFFSALNMELAPNGFVSTEKYPIELSNKLADADIKEGFQWGETVIDEENQFGDTDDLLIYPEVPKEEVWSPWLLSVQGSAYSFIAPSGRACEKMSNINNQYVDTKTAMRSSCFVVAVDINGLKEGPNKLEPQQISGINPKEKLKKLTGDRYYIYIANDGIATGSSDLTITGKVVVRSEVKLPD